MLVLALDPQRGEPLFKQVASRIRELVDGGSLRGGDILPPTRILAGQLGVSRSTVCRAYEELWALGYLDSRSGSYSRVRNRRRPIDLPAEPPLQEIDWAEYMSPASAGICTSPYPEILMPCPQDDGAIDFTILSLDPRLFPMADLRHCARRALSDERAPDLNYGLRHGYPPLREYLARQLRRYGITASAQEILITNGSMHGMELLTRFFVAPGDTVLVESPTYGFILPVLHFHGARVESVPVKADGPDLDALAARLRRRRAKFVYMMPTFQNPTGVTMSQLQRERLLGLCEKYRVPLLEDGFSEDITYFDKVVQPVKSMDRHGLVFFLGTFSKTLMPGLRIGWIAAERSAIDRLATLKMYSDLTTSAPTQLILYEMGRQGIIDRHMAHINRIYARRMRALIAGLTQHLPAGVLWNKPKGGYLVWLRLPCQRSRAAELRERVARDTARHGVRVMAGDLFFPGRPPADLCLRLSISLHDESEITEGCRRLGAALHESLVGFPVR